MVIMLSVAANAPIKNWKEFLGFSGIHNLYNSILSFQAIGSFLVFVELICVRGFIEVYAMCCEDWALKP
jgi:hypothetical protein